MIKKLIEFKVGEKICIIRPPKSAICRVIKQYREKNINKTTVLILEDGYNLRKDSQYILDSNSVDAIMCK